jgi:DNA gyrase/topoisomerase IV subunit B
VYNLDDKLELKNSETSKYYKGLGSFKSNDLKHIIKTDGIDTMIKLFDIDDYEVLDDWLSSEKSNKRKEYLQNNSFDITGV